MNTELKRRPLAAALGLAVIASLSGLLATPAQAATQQVTITSGGYVPQSLSIRVGDTVTYTNSDTVAHQVEFRPTAGMTCTVAPFVIQPTKQASCTFTAVGSYTATDPNNKGNTYRGTIAVTAASPSPTPTPTPTAATLQSVTLGASKDLVIYGSGVSLGGKVNLAKAGITVDILAKESGQSAFAKVGTTATTANGSYQFATSPRIGTEYRAHAVDGTRTADSALFMVKVRPKVTLANRFVRAHTAGFRTTVRALKSHAGARVLIQRRGLNGWATVRTATLGQFSALSFRVRIPDGISSWRVVLPLSQAQPGYLSGFSPANRIAH